MTAVVPQVGSRDQNVKWFDKSVTVPVQARDLLEEYSRIPAEDVAEHVISLVSAYSLLTLLRLGS